VKANTEVSSFYEILTSIFWHEHI